MPIESQGGVHFINETDERRRVREADRRAFARPTRGVLGRRSRLILVFYEHAKDFAKPS